MTKKATHRMQDVFAVSDRVAVLRRGRKVADKAIARANLGLLGLYLAE